jgi:hypothetical protein
MLLWFMLVPAQQVDYDASNVTVVSNDKEGFLWSMTG